MRTKGYKRSPKEEKYFAELDAKNAKHNEDVMNAFRKWMNDHRERDMDTFEERSTKGQVKLKTFSDIRNCSDEYTLASDILAHKKAFYAGRATMPDEFYDALVNRLRDINPSHRLVNLPQ